MSKLHYGIVIWAALALTPLTESEAKSLPASVGRAVSGALTKKSAAPRIPPRKATPIEQGRPSIIDRTKGILASWAPSDTFYKRLMLTQAAVG